MRDMTVRVVFWPVLMTTTWIGISSVRTHTVNGTEACYIKISNTKVRLIPYDEVYQETCWIFFGCIAFRTSYIRQTYTEFRLKNVSCSGETSRKSNKDLRTCDCDQPQGECDSICEHRDLYDNLEVNKLLRYCSKGYSLNINRGVCEPVCATSCSNGWCQEPNVCACEYNFGNNGIECVHVERSACVHGYRACKSQSDGKEIERGLTQRQPCDYGYDECKCHFGWVGDFCETPSHCLVAKFPLSDKSPEFEAHLTGRSQKPLSELTWSAGLEKLRILPACSQKCPNQLYHESDAFFQDNNLTVTFYVVPNEVRCKSIKRHGNNFSNKFSNVLLGTLLGFTSLTILYFVVISVRKTWKVKCTPYHRSLSPVYDDIG
ncbi:multiple epidermal growth factor-like domains protein 10 [Neodiprion pinetum]|uniref:Uncharacterized protein LOC107227290 n=1 Tax=Neodiprion lecontei TaxID=441921 RepID=A0ABM3FYJ7_NEOLC|nr:uncharacterized protein LOC124216591 [Neodiprion pinetum]XP_046593101.1 uncharacterized protein LOC107227290 [Neodiprion lecontei]